VTRGESTFRKAYDTLIKGRKEIAGGGKTAPLCAGGNPPGKLTEERRGKGGELKEKECAR